MRFPRNITADGGIIEIRKLESDFLLINQKHPLSKSKPNFFIHSVIRRTGVGATD